MIKNVFIISEHSQIRELGSKLKYDILNELIKNSGTCQQLTDIFGISKQKMHYHLKGLLEEGLVKIDQTVSDNNKEVYYQAQAKNYILDFSVGLNTGKSNLNHREILNSIMQTDYSIILKGVAGNLLDRSLKMKAREKLLIVTGEYNMPLVENILLEASKRMIEVTLIYQNREILEAKYNEMSLAALKWSYDYFNNQLKKHDVYLNLNGETRNYPLHDKKKLSIQHRAFEQSREIINKHKIKVAMMPGLINDTLHEDSIVSEINFWKSLNVDYDRLYKETDELRQLLIDYKKVTISNIATDFSFEVESILCEYGSFTDSAFQSPVINLPGGEILLIPRRGTMTGIISAKVGYIFGEKVIAPQITVKDNKIVTFKAETNERLIEQAIERGGDFGSEVALICLGTNYNMDLDKIDMSFKSKSKGLVTIYWGENLTLGGTVSGLTEWYIQLENPVINGQE